MVVFFAKYQSPQSCGIKNFSIFLFHLLFFIRFCLGCSSKQCVLEYQISNGSVKVLYTVASFNYSTFKCHSFGLYLLGFFLFAFCPFVDFWTNNANFIDNIKKQRTHFHNKAHIACSVAFSASLSHLVKGNLVPTFPPT